MTDPLSLRTPVEKFLLRIEPAFRRASRENKQSFEFEGKVYDADYAKFLTEYLTAKFKVKRK